MHLGACRYGEQLQGEKPIAVASRLNQFVTVDHSNTAVTDSGPYGRLISRPRNPTECIKV